jgi:hypothetical protein
MIVTTEPPGLHRVDSLYAVTLTRQEGSNVDVGGCQAAHAGPSYVPS